MNNDLTKMRQATAQVLASQKQLENKYRAAQQGSEDWYRRVQLALGKGEEDLAREALKRRKAYAVNLSSRRLLEEFYCKVLSFQKNLIAFVDTVSYLILKNSHNT
ncbi:probable membrane-associated 30 kDa protein, chloroplastic isoform X2 [Actinidia eriantha]|nr:probable membrane-associated 30 kDa protein, chloroplastic isoform X2 [Actinidia eriantha]